MASNTAAALMRQQYKEARNWFYGTIEGLSNEQLHWRPDGQALPIAAHVAHIVCSEDGVINGMLQNKPPLMAGAWATKTGLSEPPPPGFEWREWGSRVKVDLAAHRAYADAVFAATDAYIGSLSDADLEPILDLPLGKYSIASMLTIMQHNVLAHTGEISCLKGLKGGKGYPF